MILGRGVRASMILRALEVTQAVMNEDPQPVSVFGDSHSTLFFPTHFYAGRLGYKEDLPVRVSGQSIRAASLAGFRPGSSKLNVKDEISKALPDAQKMVLAFGQVDLELGFYYRLAIKGEETDPTRYVQWLLSIYRDFLGSLDFSHCDVALKGVNLTALSPRGFATRYVSRIVTEGKDMTWKEAVPVVRPHILAENGQNAMHLAFNAGLQQLAEDVGVRYFDLNEDLAASSHPSLAAGPIRLADQFKTGAFDHHVADTVVARRVHYEGLLKAFDLL